MPTLKMTITLEKDGVAVSGFPIVRRLDVSGAHDFDYQQPNDATFDLIQAGTFASLQALVVRAMTQPVTVRVNGQSDAGIGLNAGGFLVVFDGTIGPTSTALLKNGSTAPTEVLGASAGS